MKKKTPELYLFIIWSKGRIKEKEILIDLQQQLEVLEVREVEWSKPLFLKSLSRFYGIDFLPNSIDILNRGLDPFLLITVMDKKPRYEVTEVSSGHSKVNVNILNLKKKYRALVGDEFAIHSTVTPNETRHNLSLLLGKSTKDYLNELKTNKSPSQPLKRELLGSKGWSSLDEVFSVLNESINYVMLRNFEGSPKELGTKSDIDLLVDDISLEKAPYILNAKTTPDDVPGTIMCQVLVDGKSVLFHLHSYSYLPAKWVIKILKNRSLNKNNLYIPPLEDRFYSLVYQLTMWKTYVKEEYYQELARLFQLLFPKVPPDENDFDNYVNKLQEFLCQNQYFPNVHTLKRPNPSEILAVAKEHLEALDITDIKPFKIDMWKPSLGYKMFTGIIHNNKKVFIKYFGERGFVAKEYKVLSFLNKKYPALFPKPLFYSVLPARHQFLVMEFINGQPLTKSIWAPLQHKDKFKIISNIVDIIRAFNDNKLIYRDMFPSNILVTKDNCVFIIDYEYAIDNSQKLYKKHQYENTNLDSLYVLGEPYALGRYQWNDAHSAIKIIQELEPDFETRYPSLSQQLEAIKQGNDSTYILDLNSFQFIKKRIKRKLARILMRYVPIFKKISHRILT